MAACDLHGVVAWLIGWCCGSLYLRGQHNTTPAKSQAGRPGLTLSRTGRAGHRGHRPKAAAANHQPKAGLATVATQGLTVKRHTLFSTLMEVASAPWRPRRVSRSRAAVVVEFRTAWRCF